MSHCRAIQFSIFPSLPESSTPSPLAGGEGWDGGEKHGLGTPPAWTPPPPPPPPQGGGKEPHARGREQKAPGHTLPLLASARQQRVAHKGSTNKTLPPR